MKKNVFIAVTFSRLWKSEFRDLVTKVIELVNNQNPDALDLRFVYDELGTAYSGLQQMHVPYGKHPLSSNLSELRKKRMKLIRALVAQIKALQSTNAVYDIPQLEVIAAFVQRYLSPIVGTNSSKTTDTLNEMFSFLNTNQSVTDAINNLNLRNYFEELRVLQSSFAQTETERSTSKSERQKVNTSEVRIKAETALSNLLKEIALMQLKHTDVDYNPLINGMNELFASYGSQVKSRSTRRNQMIVKRKDASIQTTTTAQNSNSGAVVIGD